MKKKLLAGLVVALLARSVFAFEPFQIKDIRVEGIQRTEAGTVFGYLPVKVGETLNDEKAAQSIKALFATGFFRDVRIEVDGGVMVVVVQERPAAPVLPTMVTKTGYKTSAFIATAGGILLMLAPALLPMFDSPEAQQLTQKSAIAAFAFAGLRMALQAITAYSVAKAARPPANPPPA